jgi:uncharacterized protein (DUF433 family)
MVGVNNLGTVSLTLNEAGYVVGQSATAINRAIDRGIIKAQRQRQGKAQLRRIGPAELRFLAISNEVEKDLTPAARRKVYEAVRRLPADEHLLAVGVMEFRLSEIDQRIANRLHDLTEIKALIEERDGADAVIRGTEISAYVIAALTTGETTPEIIHDFPGLTIAQINAANEYAKLRPRHGRPLPTRSFKKMLSDMAANGVWDIDIDEEPLAPQLMP